MASARPVFARDDTLLGACQGLGEDFGFNPTCLRVLFALGLFASPFVAPLVYAGLAALVALVRWLVPDPLPLPLEAPGDAVDEEERQALAWEEMALAA